MDRYIKNYHVRYVSLKHCKFFETLMSEVGLMRLSEDKRVQVLYIASIEELVKGE